MTAEIYGANTPIVPDETVEKWLGKEPPVKKMTKKEFIQKQIEELQTALKLLEIEENRKSPCEKAYQDAYGKFPVTDSMSGGDKDYIAWDAFQKGWEAHKEYHTNDIEDETQEPNFQQIMNDHFEKNKSPTLKERFEEYLATKVDWAQSYHVIANELVDITKKWIPNEHETNSYEWNKCVQNMKNRLR